MITLHRTPLLVVGLLMIAAAGSVGCGSRTEAESPVAAEQRIPVRTAPVGSRDLTEVLTLTGSLEARARVAVVSEVSARLLRVLVQEGQRVKKGAPLAVLDDTDFRLARDRAKAALDV